VETVQNHTPVSHRFHRPLEIAHTTRDSTFTQLELRGPGKVENQKQVSHFPTARDNGSYTLFPIFASLADPSATLWGWAILAGQRWARAGGQTHLEVFGFRLGIQECEKPAYTGSELEIVQ
jgi:hypothetical protein